MDRAQVIAKLKAAEPELRAHGVSALYLFGSFARDEGREDSDVDVFVDKTPGRGFALDDFMGAYAVLQHAIPDMQIGYTTREGIVDAYRRYIEQDAIRIFSWQLPRTRVRAWSTFCSTSWGSRKRVPGHLRHVHVRLLPGTYRRARGGDHIGSSQSAPVDLLDKYPNTEWQKIISIGNFLRHEYERIDPEVMWDIATVHLPALEPIIRKMLADPSS
jgi:uncharacterized protein